MRWVHMEISAGFSWPNRLVEFPFEGHRIVLQPRTETLTTSANLYVAEGTTFDEGGSTLLRFLSLLAWSHEASLVDLWAHGSNDPAQAGRTAHAGRNVPAWTPVDPWWTLYLPSVRDPKAALALALFREGMGVRSAPLAFLSFFKVFNILHSAGAGQKAWVSDNLKLVHGLRAVDRLAVLREHHPDIAEYLWEQGRCAVAHAYSVTVNPDEYAEKRRLADDLPLIKELSALFIEAELHVERDSTFHARIRDSRADQPQLFRHGEEREGRLVYVPCIRPHRA